MTATTTATASTTSTAIRAQDFSSSTRDALRDRWTGGKLRHLVAALDGAPVAIIVDKATGFALVGARLVGVRSGSLYVDEAQVIVETTHADGTTTRTAYRASAIGDTVIPLGERVGRGAKWDLTDAVRREARAAIDRAMTDHGTDRAWGAWTSRPLIDGVLVTYEPHTGNEHFADVRGERGSWTYRLDALDVEPARA